MLTTSAILICYVFLVTLPYLFRRTTSVEHAGSAFAVGHRNFHWFTIGSGLTATFVGGAALLNIPSVAYTFGWYALVDSIAGAIGLVVSGLLITRLVRQSTRAVSLGTYLRAAGPLIAGVTGVLSVVVYTLICAAQLRALSAVLTPHFGLPGWLLSTLFAAPVAGYIIYNGYTSVTITDRAQALMIVFGFLLVVVIALLAFSPPEDRRYTQLPQAMPLDVIFLLAIPLLFVPVSQDVHIRIHSARSTRHATLGCLLAGLVYLAIGLAGTTLGVRAGVAGVKVQSPDDVTITYLKAVLGDWAVIPIVAVLVAIVSTLDSVLFAASASLAYDIRFSRDMREGARLSPLIATVSILCTALVISFLAPRILSVILSALIIYVVVLFPMLLGLALRVKEQYLAYTAMAALVVTASNEAVGYQVSYRLFVFCGMHALVIIVLALSGRLRADTKGAGGELG